MSDAPAVLAEVSASDWADAGPGWTHLPYLARFPAARLPAAWSAFLTGRHHAVLESGRTGTLTIAVPAAPRATLFFADGRVVLHAEDGAHEETTEKPLAYLRRWSREVRAPRLPGWPAFQGGLLALLGYELAAQFEPVRPAPADVRAPLAAFLEAHEACVFDAAKQELTVVVLCPAGAPNAALRAARARARELAARWHAACGAPGPASPAAPAVPAAPLAASFDEAGFVRAVARCQEYIAAGDTYQVNLSTRLEVPPVDALAAYEALRSANPSPYMGFVRLPGVSLACGSPELLVEVAGGRVASRPIAGTRPRGADEAADLAWARELAGDTKEKAEHLMLVDLLRNDVGRVSRPGTVRVPEFMAVERYSHVMHLVSQVEGDLAAGAGPADVVRALFPGGTVTGAPKVRTMQVIAELEPVARGYYTGSLGWIGASGELCLNIIIRSLWTAEGRAFVQAGAGVVADSVPAREYAESLRKAQAPLLAAARAALP
ncbi:MAG: anthranilate synthase component I family protein [Verrucomicrobia bacterium]|nr:anthranilate synthase component I family protein [Verrucomicrobiota bacterium]